MIIRGLTRIIREKFRAFSFLCFFSTTPDIFEVCVRWVFNLVSLTRKCTCFNVTRNRQDRKCWNFKSCYIYCFFMIYTRVFFSDSRRALHRQYSLWLSTRYTKAIIHRAIPLYGRLQNSYDNSLLWFRGKRIIQGYFYR